MDVLLVDVDPGADVYSRAHVKRLLDRAGYQLKEMHKWRSVSGKGWHVAIVLDRKIDTPMEIVALQAIMGSDRYREACNVMRARTVGAMARKYRAFWGTRWNVFYRGRR